MIEPEFFAVEKRRHFALERGEPGVAGLRDQEHEENQRARQDGGGRGDPNRTLEPRSRPGHPRGGENCGLEMWRRLGTLAYFAGERRVDAALAGEPRGEIGIALRLVQRLLKARVRGILAARTVGAENESGFLVVHGLEF